MKSIQSDFLKSFLKHIIQTTWEILKKRFLYVKCVVVWGIDLPDVVGEEMKRWR